MFGTAFGIALTRTRVPVLPAFVALTVGHLYSSWREVKAFELPYLNRTRLAYTARRFLATGESCRDSPSIEHHHTANTVRHNAVDTSNGRLTPPSMVASRVCIASQSVGVSTECWGFTLFPPAPDSCVSSA